MFHGAPAKLGPGSDEVSELAAAVCARQPDRSSRASLSGKLRADPLADFAAHAVKWRKVAVSPAEDQSALKRGKNHHPEIVGPGRVDPGCFHLACEQSPPALKRLTRRIA